LTSEPAVLLEELNAFLDKVKSREVSLRDFPAFGAEDLRRLAFFMATGSGKTLLLHVNLWQVLHYLERGRQPKALVNKADQRRAFDTILLITPNEGLSQQHIIEFKHSGIEATLLIEDRSGQGTFELRVKVIEIHKLAEEASKEGVSILLEELGSSNLVFVDEGHKGTGSEARTWKTRQKYLSENGFLLEYSATFAQSIGAASKKIQAELLGEYGKTILFDYSYTHFYEDGYGKDFRVLNLAKAREDQAHELLLGGLLVYFQQLFLFRKNSAVFRPYNLERPLWVFLGSSVNAVYKQEQRTRSDVATVVAFLKRFLEDPSWAISGIRRILKAESGFRDADTKEDLFAPRLTNLEGRDPRELYNEIAERVFHGRGGLEVWEVKSAEGELGLRLSTSTDRENHYFGVVNIGDVSAFKKHLTDSLGIEVREDRFTPSLFGEIDRTDSRVNVLVGAKKFIEGWSSWRVSAMGLLNIGKGEGPQVIQLFGRGVRLKGRDWSLKRSAAADGNVTIPKGLSELETLHIFGWNADYIRSFRKMIEREDLGKVVQVPVRTLFDPWPILPIPQRQAGYNAEAETWTLLPEFGDVSVDLCPKITSMAGEKVGAGVVGERTEVDFSDPDFVALLDASRLYIDLVEYKSDRGYKNVFIPRYQIVPLLKAGTLFLAKTDRSNPSILQQGASKLLKTYLDRFVARKEREAESHHMESSTIPKVHESIVPYYTVRVSSEELLKELEALVRKRTQLYQDGGKPLPRLHFDRHLFSPILRDPENYALEGISVSPSGLSDDEAKFLEELRNFWTDNHENGRYRKTEVYVLRNLPRVGVGFFRRSGFYPDFILWIQNKAEKTTRVRFVEPHGMHHGGLSGNKDKIEAFNELQELSKETAFSKKKILLDGYILTQTDLKKIPGAEDKSWLELENQFKILRQQGSYIEKLLS
jgi:type III restriction/modification enzyme restriction subunit